MQLNTIFVEKPHSFEKVESPKNMVIGYNFCHMSCIPDIKDISRIDMGTADTYTEWVSLFDSNQTLSSAMYSVIIHALSIMIHKYGPPGDAAIKADATNVHITLVYGKVPRIITYTSEASTFFMNIVADGKVYNCKDYKADSYYNIFGLLFQRLRSCKLLQYCGSLLQRQ
jgi:hypothetical protein